MCICCQVSSMGQGWLRSWQQRAHSTARSGVQPETVGSNMSGKENLHWGGVAQWIRPWTLKSWGPRFESAGSGSRLPLGKALYPHCLVPWMFILRISQSYHERIMDEGTSNRGHHLCMSLKLFSNFDFDFDFDFFFFFFFFLGGGSWSGGTNSHFISKSANM